MKDNFKVSISKQELAQLPTRQFSGNITVVTTADQAELAAEQLEKAPIIGFDTETKPSFQKGHLNHVALLQLATPEMCFLIRISHIGLPPRIKAILENKSILKVGLSIKDDFHNLAKLGPISPDGFIDLQEYVRRFSIADASLTKLHAIVFGERISKSQQLSNWEAPSLTPKQQEYAALDALACIDIYNSLSSGSFSPASSPYRIDLCEEN